METSQNEDKRVKRTKRLLKETLTNLLLEKDIQQITVKSIVERADLNRGTFYLHYTDVYDLLKEIENEVLQKFDSLAEEYFLTRNADSSYMIGGKAFHYVYENKRVCQALFLSQSNRRFIAEFQQIIIRRALHQGMSQIAFDPDDEKKKEEAKNLYEYLSCFAAGGLISILTNWLKAEDPLPPEAMITITDMILYDTLDSRRLLR